MSAYTNLEALKERFGQDILIRVTDRGSFATGVIDTSVVDHAISAAGAVIDGFLAVRYELPLAHVPPLVLAIAEDIAIYKLHSYTPDPKIKDDYDAAMRTLRDISDGRVKLPIAGVKIVDSGEDGVKFTDRERPLTHKTLGGFI